MFESRNHSRDIFSESYRSLMGGVLLLGSALVVLGIMIFMFPELIGFLFATLILSAGAVVLYWAYRVWRFKKHVTGYRMEQETEPLVYELRRDGPGYNYRRFTLIMK